MADPKDQPPQPADSDELDGLGSLMGETAVPATPSVAPGAADDDKIDLKALAQLSSIAPRGSAVADEPAPAVAPAAFVNAPAGMPKKDRSSQDARVVPLDADRLRVPPPPPVAQTRNIVLALAFGFLLGVPVGAWLFTGRVATVPMAQAPQADERDRPQGVAIAAAPEPSAEPAAPIAPQAPAQPVAPPPSAAAPVEPPAAPTTVASAAPVAGSTAKVDSARSSAPARAQAVAAPAIPSAPASASSSAPTAAPSASSAAPVMVLQKVKPADTLPTSATAAREEPGEEAPPPSAASETKDKSHVDNLLDEALSGNAKVGHAPPPAAEIPFTPSRDEVSAAMAVLLPAIRGCAMGQAGLATAGIVVQNDGRVASVSVTGAPFEGSASGRCMEGVVRRAHFPRFKQPSFRVQFPFAIQ